MKATIALQFICDFKENLTSNNQVIGLPDYLAKIANNGENPIREFLTNVEPGCRLNFVISVEVLPPRSK